MASKHNIKKPSGNNNKLSKTEGGCTQVQHPFFSFLHFTSNDKYNFSYFNSNQARDARIAYEAFNKRLVTLSASSWLHWGQLGRVQGLEMLPVYGLRPSPKGYTFTNDQKCIVFRFGDGGKYRILGFRKSSCPILHVFGIDWDHSAYDHGS